MQYLRKQAKEAIKEYVTEHLPEQYQICLTALDTILKHSFEILQTSQDNREKLQAMELFKDTHLVKLELLSNATTIDSALNFIRNKQEEEEQQKGIATDLAAATTTTNTTIAKSSVISNVVIIPSSKCFVQIFLYCSFLFFYMFIESIRTYI